VLFRSPEGFGEKIFRTWQGQSEDISLDIRYDQSDLMVSEQILSITDSITRAFARIEVPITLNATPLNLKAKITYIDFIAPGIIVFGLLILIPTAARMMVRDKELGFLSRMLTTPTKPSEFIAGYSLCLLAIAVAQIVIFMLMGRLFGMDIVGNIGLAFVTFLLTGLCCIGIGMIIASLTKTQNQAEPLSWLISMPMATISGAWFAIEFMPTWLRSVAYAFPFAHSIDASRDILTRGTGLGAVSNDYMFLGIWTVVVFAAGILLFRRSMTS
jgi:ABC-2 type transport system permease protein